MAHYRRPINMKLEIRNFLTNHWSQQKTIIIASYVKQLGNFQNPAKGIRGQ